MDETTIDDATTEQHLEALRAQGHLVRVEEQPRGQGDPGAEAPDRTVERMRVSVAESWLFRGQDLRGWDRDGTSSTYLDELDAALQRAYPDACIEEIGPDERVAEIGVGVEVRLRGDDRWSAPRGVIANVRRIAAHVRATAPFWVEAEEDEECPDGDEGVV
jgi:hypothetical protein